MAMARADTVASRSSMACLARRSLRTFLDSPSVPAAGDSRTSASPTYAARAGANAWSTGLLLLLALSNNLAALTAARAAPMACGGAMMKSMRAMRTVAWQALMSPAESAGGAGAVSAASDTASLEANDSASFETVTAAAVSGLRSGTSSSPARRVSSAWSAMRRAVLGKPLEAASALASRGPSGLSDLSERTAVTTSRSSSVRAARAQLWRCALASSDISEDPAGFRSSSS